MHIYIYIYIQCFLNAGQYLHSAGSVRGFLYLIFWAWTRQGLAEHILIYWIIEWVGSWKFQGWPPTPTLPKKQGFLGHYEGTMVVSHNLFKALFLGILQATLTFQGTSPYSTKRESRKLIIFKCAMVGRGHDDVSSLEGWIYPDLVWFLWDQCGGKSTIPHGSYGVTLRFSFNSLACALFGSTWMSLARKVRISGL